MRGRGAEGRNPRWALATALAPVGPVLVFGAVIALDAVRSGELEPWLLLVLAIVAAISWIVGLVVTMVLRMMRPEGVPVRWWAYGLLGLVVGFLVGVVLDAPHVDPSRLTYYGPVAMSGACSGLCYRAALFFGQSGSILES